MSDHLVAIGSVGIPNWLLIIIFLALAITAIVYLAKNKKRWDEEDKKLDDIKAQIDKDHKEIMDLAGVYDVGEKKEVSEVKDGKQE